MTASTTPSASFGAWWRPRLQGAPPELRDHLTAIVPALLLDVPLADAVEQLQIVAAQRLHQVLADPDTRDAALELLAVDALVTYLVEAAASLGLALDAWSEQLMRQLASVSVPSNTP